MTAPRAPLASDPDALLRTLEWPTLPELVRRLFEDEERRRAVRETGLLDAEADAALDRLTQLAARALDAPRAAVTLLEPHRQVFVGRTGLERRETSIAHSFCQYAAASGRSMAVRDTTQDPVLRDNPATHEGVRSYLGVPLVTRDGHALGTVCVFGDAPREWSALDVELLTDVARVVMSELELRRTLRRLAAADDDGSGGENGESGEISARGRADV